MLVQAPVMDVWICVWYYATSLRICQWYIVLLWLWKSRGDMKSFAGQHTWWAPRMPSRYMPNQPSRCIEIGSSRAMILSGDGKEDRWKLAMAELYIQFKFFDCLMAKDPQILFRLSILYRVCAFSFLEGGVLCNLWDDPFTLLTSIDKFNLIYLQSCLIDCSLEAPFPPLFPHREAREGVSPSGLGSSGRALWASNSRPRPLTRRAGPAAVALPGRWIWNEHRGVLLY